jgi:uncharacterized Zn finger protein
MSDIIPCPWCGGTDADPVTCGTEDREGVPMALRCMECGSQAPWQYIPKNIANKDSIVKPMLIKTWNERFTK